ncbi:hypothetical protein LACPH_002561 [Lacticaseibacillus parahuelsenbergensis]|uniref:Uncharacterized protein n=1 Tax=Lacticaseibacillus parahuelsenbergensis TaxID=3068305 RepID=A0ABY9L211_9LACO|nr:MULTISPECIES: hypothetical protein [Lacticaseibacillus]MDE3283670.1 hypothetical protein [Lacticaseibacillus casei]WLV77782.1 hypothetical protein LACPH_002561 [Lacticaseibacillus sp. NCIMB 15471]
MLQYIYRLLVISGLAFIAYFAYDARVFTPGKKINLKRDLVLGLIFLVLLFVTAYVSKFVNK